MERGRDGMEEVKARSMSGRKSIQLGSGAGACNTAELGIIIA